MQKDMQSEQEQHDHCKLQMRVHSLLALVLPHAAAFGIWDTQCCDTTGSWQSVTCNMYSYAYSIYGCCGAAGMSDVCGDDPEQQRTLPETC